jgi:predicted TIM-barrel fold metal-dependent hydrolase
MARVAAEPNVAVKISGLGLPGAAWTLEANGPVIRDTVAIFGPRRCMFASNFPVDSLVASYDTIVEVMRAALAGLADEERESIFLRNAIRIYRLDPALAA